MNNTTSLDCICGTTHTFPAGVGAGTCAGCGIGLLLTEDVSTGAAIDAMIPDAEALQSPAALVAKIGLLLELGDRLTAIGLAERALDAAREEGREEAAADRDGDPAEDYEPDVSDEGFDPYVGSFTDDC